MEQNYFDPFPLSRLCSPSFVRPGRSSAARKLQAIQDYKKSLLTQFFDKSVLSEVEGLRAGKKNSKNCSNNP